jgi:multicopper oxidase
VPQSQKYATEPQEFTYSFAVAEPGTYWYHSHVGVQLDRGLAAAGCLDDPVSPRVALRAW